MGQKYRSWDERREIIKAIIADSSPRPLASFNLTESEQLFFRARAARTIDETARATSSFKSYYKLPTANPFGYVITTTSLVLIFAASIAAFLFWNGLGVGGYSLLAALTTLSGVAIGWTITGWVTHRNTIRQNTNNMLFARFSQATFTEAMHRFHKKFGYDPKFRVTREAVVALRQSDSDDDWKTASSVGYLLNYFELVAHGVLKGDLDAGVVRGNIRGAICFYYDLCEPYIQSANNKDPRTFEHLRKMRTHYREP